MFLKIFLCIFFYEPAEIMMNPSYREVSFFLSVNTYLTLITLI